MTDRMDYMNNVGNNFVYCMAVEKLVDLDVPERAQAIRVILAELTRISSHLIMDRNLGIGPGGYVSVYVCHARAGDDPGYSRNVLRPAHDGHLYPSRRFMAGRARLNLAKLFVISSRCFRGGWMNTNPC